MRRPFEFEHFVVPRRFKATGFELVSNLDLLVVLALVVQVVFQFHDEFNGFSKPVHDEFLRSESLDLGDLESLFLFGQFSEDVLLFSLELYFFNARFLFLFRRQDLRQEPFLTVRLWSGRDDFNDALSDFLFQTVILDEHVLVDLLQIANLQARIGELVGRGVVNTAS